MVLTEENASQDGLDSIDVTIEGYDLAKVHDGVIMVTRIIEPEDILANFEILEDAQLPEGVVPLSPILRLTPEDYDFPHPVQLILPACCGATKAWRSTSTGWEELQDALFFRGYVLLRLTHFCDVFAGAYGNKHIDINWKQSGSQIQTRWAIRHLGKCDRCAERLQLYMGDPYFLEGFEECRGVFDLGTKTHGSQLTIISNTSHSTDTCTLTFATFPLLMPDVESPVFLPEGCSSLKLQAGGGGGA